MIRRPTVEEYEKAKIAFREKFDAGSWITDGPEDLFDDFIVELFNIAFLHGWNGALDEMSEQDYQRRRGIEQMRERHGHLRAAAYDIRRWRR